MIIAKVLGVGRERGGDAAGGGAAIGARLGALSPRSPGAGRRLNPSLVVGAMLVALVIVVALVSFAWTPYPPSRVDTGVAPARPVG